MSIPHRSGDTGLKRLPFLKYYDVLKRENGFTCGLNTAKIIDYIKKLFK